MASIFEQAQAMPPVLSLKQNGEEEPTQVPTPSATLPQHQIGGYQPGIGREQLQAEAMQDRSLLMSAWRESTIISPAIDSIARALDYPIDPEYTQEKWEADFDKYRKDLPQSKWRNLFEAGSTEEMAELHADAKESLRDQETLQAAGMTGTMAALSMGIIGDVDSVFMLAPVMKAFGSVARTAKMAQKGTVPVLYAEAAAQSAVQELAVHQAKAVPRLKWAKSVHESETARLTAAVEASKAVLDDAVSGASKALDARTANVLPNAGSTALLGAGYGAAFGLSEYTFNPGGTPEDLVGGLLFGTALGLGAGSIGAGLELRSIKNAQKGLNQVGDDFIKAVQDPRFGKDAEENVSLFRPVFAGLDRTVIDQGIDSVVQGIKYTKGDSFIADSFSKVLNKFKLGGTAEELMQSKSKAAKALAFLALETPSGAWNRTATAAITGERFMDDGLRGIAGYKSAFRAWAKQQGVGLLDREFSSDVRRMFDLEVMKERFRRYKGGDTSKRYAHPVIHQLADELDAAYTAVGLHARGRDGEIPLNGFANFEPRNGYFHLEWMGNQMLDALKTHGDKKVQDLIALAYKRANPDMADEVASILSKAAIRRARGKAGDIDMPIITSLREDQSAWIEQFLIDNNVPANLADSVRRHLSVETVEKGRLGVAKHRTPIDLDAELDGLSLWDLINTDVYGGMVNYSRSVGKRAALARIGIDSNAKIQEIKALIKSEDPSISMDLLDGVFSHFTGGPVAGGVSDVVKRLNQLTTLNFLNQVGLAQLAETGVTIASIGLGRMFKYMPEVKQVLTREGPKSPLWQDLKFLGGNIIDEHLLRNDALAADYARHSMGRDIGFWATYDKLVRRGLRAQGYTSLMYQVKQAQLTWNVFGMTDKLMGAIKSGKGMSARRLADAGFSPEDIARIKSKYIDTGTVQFKNGSIDRLNLDQWDVRDVDLLQTNMYRLTNQNVQKAMAGETNIWLHKDFGALMTQFQSFPIVAMQKQLSRNLRIQDVESAGMFLYGLMTAGTAYGIKQIINGQYDSLTPEKLAYGSIMYGNMTGFVPSIVNPLAYMFGLDDYQMGPGASARGTGGMFSPPPFLSMANSVASLPRAAVHAVQGEFKKKDAAIVKQGLPMLGNMYGMAAFWNMLGED